MDLCKFDCVEVTGCEMSLMLPAGYAGQSLCNDAASVTLSVCRSHRPLQQRRPAGFAAVRLADGRYRPTGVGALAAGSVQQAPALSSKRGQHHVGRGLTQTC